MVTRAWAEAHGLKVTQGKKVNVQGAGGDAIPSGPQNIDLLPLGHLEPVSFRPGSGDHSNCSPGIYHHVTLGDQELGLIHPQRLYCYLEMGLRHLGGGRGHLLGGQQLPGSPSYLLNLRGAGGGCAGRGLYRGDRHD